MTSSRNSAVYRTVSATGDSHESLRLWLRLLACSSMVEGRVRSRLREHYDCTLPRFDVLAQLESASRDHVRGLTMSELSRRLMVTNGNLTGLIERLVQESLVSRVTLPSDRRSQIVRITAAGKRALHAMAPKHEEWIEELFMGLGEPDRAQLYELLGKLKASIRAGLDQEDAGD